MKNIKKIIVDLNYKHIMTDPYLGYERHLPRIEAVAKSAEDGDLCYENVIHTARNMKNFLGNLKK